MRSSLITEQHRQDGDIWRCEQYMVPTSFVNPAETCSSLSTFFCGNICMSCAEVNYAAQLFSALYSSNVLCLSSVPVSINQPCDLQITTDTMSAKQYRIGGFVDSTFLWVDDGNIVFLYFVCVYVSCL